MKKILALLLALCMLFALLPAALAADSYGTAVGPHTHQWVDTDWVDPWCTTPGGVYQYCEFCEEERFKQTSPALGHNWELVEAADATCVKTGKATYGCTRCGETKVEEGVKGDHTLIRWKEDRKSVV